eukprot:SAG25_NODE_10312_length_338_cov_1.497908_2_plen_51_part_01
MLVVTGHACAAVELMNDICKSPDCKLDPPPGEALREKDPNCGCGMCRPKFP